MKRLMSILAAALLVSVVSPVAAAEKPAPLPVNGAPVVVATVESGWGGVEPSTVCFDASKSFDPEGKPLTFAWDFGDGRGTASTAISCHVYVEAGLYAATVTITDVHGVTASENLIVYVREKPQALPAM